MAPIIIIIVLAILFITAGILKDKKDRKIREKLEASLEDESIHVVGEGRVTFEQLGDLAKGDPDEGVKYSKDTMFREDLMKFEGEFLIPALPLNEERRKSIDDAFLYLQELLGENTVLEKPMLTIDDPIYPPELNYTHDVTPIALKVAEIMDIDPASISIGFFEDSQPVKSLALDGTYESKGAAGLYYGKSDNGKHHVTFSDTIHKDPERLLATIAHEFAHIKLLGEERMDENSEELTDMVPLFYGFGLFSANSVFKFRRDLSSWSSSTLGYLSQADWAYLFALYLYIRNEQEPGWMKDLNKTVTKDCRLACEFIKANPDKILQRND